MSSFNGQMNEYTRIAIDRFDCKNLQCTAYFLSHCHKDHMVGLNSSSFVNSLRERNGVFLYCSEITRLLLLAENDYSQLINYIRVLKVGVSQRLRIPSNSISVEEYFVTVTPIAAGHCPGSVMFLFEGHEGICLYTGDFRWEINNAVGIAAFKQENRLKQIKSVYVDTTFCIPEAYHIPKRSECVDAAMTLVSDWFQKSPLNVVLISCPARYGHEHLLLELSRKLNVKIHVPEWKVQIYDQIPDLKNAFTSDPNQARIHACSAKVGYLSCLPRQKTSGDGKQVSVMKIRPSTMWFTSHKTKSTTQDLIVAPVSQRGLYRICYSMHSSYSEIRDLVSYLQPKHVFPNVLPVSDVNMEAVQTRLNIFKNYFNIARAQPSLVAKHFQPLGTLRKLLTDQTSIQQPSCKQDAESYDELVFSSQETDSSNGLLTSVHKSAVNSADFPLLAGAGQLKESKNSKKVISESTTTDNVWSSSLSQSHSSYRGSFISDKELKLFSDNGEDDKTKSLNMLPITEGNHDNQKAEHSTMCSGDCDISIDVFDEDSADQNLKADYANVFTSYSTKDIHDNIPEGDKTPVRMCTIGQSIPSTFNAEQKPSRPHDIASDCATRCSVHQIDSGCQNSSKDNCNEQTVKQIHQTEVNKIIVCSDGSKTVQCSPDYTVSTVSLNNKILSNLKNDACYKEGCQDNDNSDDNDDVVFSSQVSSSQVFIKNHIVTAIIPNVSTIHDQSDSILTLNNEFVIEKPTIRNDSSLPDYTHCSGQEIVTVLSSSDNSQNDSLEQESQSLWSVSYSLDNFTPSHSSSLVVKTTNNGTSHGRLDVNASNELSFNEEHLDCLSTDNFESNCVCKNDLPLNKVGDTEKERSNVLFNSHYNINRKARNNLSLKRKLTTSINILKAGHSDDVKRLGMGRVEDENDVFIYKITDTKEECVISSERVVKCNESPCCSLQNASCSERQIICSNRNLVKVHSTCPTNNSHVKGKDCLLSFSDLSQYKCDHKLESDDSHRHVDEYHRDVLAQSTHKSQESEYIDLTVTIPDDVVDLTLESSH